MASPCYIGVDLGTSGCRAIAITAEQDRLAAAQTPLPAPLRVDAGGVEQSPDLWWEAVVAVLRDIATGLRGHVPSALCVDGTSSTLLLCTADAAPLGPALMYNDSRSRNEARRIADAAPESSAAQGASSSLAKLLYLQRSLHPPPGTLALHQSDWVTSRLAGLSGISDWNNCLKLGYDSQRERWPDWVLDLGLDPIGLPRVVAPGTEIGNLCPEAAAATGLPPGTRIVAGTTDSTASVLAAGARAPGDAVTSLGSTLVVKILAKKPVTAPPYGVYSHRFGDLWLVGGASNSGGAVLRKYFSDAQIRQLTAELRPDEPSGLDYYPLPAPGERFPVNDPGLEPRLTPRPADDARFFQGILEGIARIEKAAYARLRSLGSPDPRSVTTIGGGAGNAGWTRIRAGLLGVPVVPAEVQEAAFGSALLALRGRAGA